MKKLLALLIITGTLGFAFAQDLSDEDEYDDFDDIFLEQTEDIVVEESSPVIISSAKSFFIYFSLIISR